MFSIFLFQDMSEKLTSNQILTIIQLKHAHCISHHYQDIYLLMAFSLLYLTAFSIRLVTERFRIQPDPVGTSEILKL